MDQVIATARPPRMRIAYRDGEGRMYSDWPLGRLDEALADARGTIWIDLDDRDMAFSEIEALLRERFRFHPLAIADALEQTNVPKVDDWGNYLYIVAQTASFEPESLDIELHELDIFLGPNYIVTYHERPLPALDSVRRLLERDGGHRLAQGPDHVLYHILDAGSAEFLPAIEQLDEGIDEAQDEVFTAPTPNTLRRILKIKQSALRLHRILIPQRELLNRLARDEYSQIDPKDRIYFRSVYDNLVRMHDISETLRDLISGALDTYLTALSNRTNEVMKTLTIVTVLFLPLNFVVGFFGMNFFGDNIHLDGLKLPHVGLFLVMGVGMLAASWGIYWWARRRGWF